MPKYIIKFWFEHGGICLWGQGEATQERYGYAIENTVLPISGELINELNDLEEEYSTYLNRDYPPDPSPWTEEHKSDFIKRATNTFNKLQIELGSGYELLNELDSCVL